MINLLPIESKKDIRAARMNVILQRYLILVGVVFMFVVLVFAAGYFITLRDRDIHKKQLEGYAQEAAKYAKVQKDSKEFATNLTTTKSILSAETIFSELVFDISKTLPKGTVLTTLNLGGETATAETTITARTKTAQGPLELKSALESSKLFKDVSIISIVNPDPARKTEGTIESLYPYSVTLKATFEKASTTKAPAATAGGN